MFGMLAPHKVSALNVLMDFEGRNPCCIRVYPFYCQVACVQLIFNTTLLNFLVTLLPVKYSGADTGFLRGRHQSQSLGKMKKTGSKGRVSI